MAGKVGKMEKKEQLIALFTVSVGQVNRKRGMNPLQGRRSTMSQSLQSHQRRVCQQCQQSSIAVNLCTTLLWAVRLRAWGITAGPTARHSGGKRRWDPRGGRGAARAQPRRQRAVCCEAEKK